jgi:hypothetical protein
MKEFRYLEMTPISQIQIREEIKSRINWSNALSFFSERLSLRTEI